MTTEQRVTYLLIKENLNYFRPYKKDIKEFVEKMSLIKEQSLSIPTKSDEQDSMISKFLGGIGQDTIEALMRTVTGRILSSLGLHPNGFFGRILVKTLSGLGLRELKAWISGDSNVCVNIAKSFSKAVREELTTGEGQKMIKTNLQYMLGYTSSGLVGNFIDLQLDRYVTEFLKENNSFEKMVEETLCKTNWMGLLKNITNFFKF